MFLRAFYIIVDLKKILQRILKKRKEEKLEDPFEKFLVAHGMKFNPFQDKVVDDFIFIGKDSKALIRILRAVNHNQSSLSIMIGPTGSGKSEDADFIVKNLPENYLYWYNQVYRQSAIQLTYSILEDLDPDFTSSLKKNRKEIIDAFNRLLIALPRKNKKLFCIFDQGENFSKDALEFVVNCTNPHYAGERSFSALILAVPRFEKRLNKWLESYDTTLRRIVVKEYVRPFTHVECIDYIVRGIAVSKGIKYEDILESKNLDPFELNAIEPLIEISQGHPATLCNLCYSSMEIASEISPTALITKENVKEAWKKYPNKTLHKKAIEWYRAKGLLGVEHG